MNSLREHLSLPAELPIKCMNENMCVFVMVHVPYEEIWLKSQDLILCLRLI